MASKLKAGEIAAAPKLFAQVQPLRAEYKKVYNRMKYVVSTRVGTDTSDDGVRAAHEHMAGSVCQVDNFC